MLVPRAMPKLSEDSQMSPTERLGLSQPVGGAEQQGQVVEARGHIGVLRTKALFIDRQRPPVKGLSLGVLALGLVKRRQIVEALS